MSLGLFGEEPAVSYPKGRPKQVGIEFTRLGSGPTPDAIRVRLVDRETAKQIGSKVVPWFEFSEISQQGALVLLNIDIGVHE